ncbi:hypothetical protein [Alteribacter aurantiacus]|uniref:hypothetical protein n=1 Tax=Alteribacter aurantiacus TaxID=254410 RepID=UPI0003FA6C13|nr:hypothetical protein [Alteribacter aurantiacus]
MNVMEVLLQLPQQSLSEILYHIEGEKERSRQRCVERVIRSITDVSNRTKSLNKLDRCGKQLVIFTSQSIHIEWQYHELVGLVTKSEKENVPRSISILEREGWLFPTTKGKWTIPDELKKIVTMLLKKSSQDDIVYIPNTEVKEDLTILFDLYSFMDEVSEKKFVLTNQQTIGKLQLKSLLKKMEYKEEVPNEQWRFGYGRHFYHYPDRFSLIYSFAFTNGWIKEEDVLVVTKEWSKAEELSTSQFMKRFILAYIKEYSRAIPQLPYLLKLIRLYLNRQEKALEKDALVSLITPYVDSYYYDDARQIVEKRILAMLVHLDLLLEKRIGDEVYYTLSNDRLTEADWLMM